MKNILLSGEIGQILSVDFTWLLNTTHGADYFHRRHANQANSGGHGGGDKALLDDIFVLNPPADKYLRNSDERGGAASILVGVAANQCFETGQPVQLASLVKGWERPDLTPLPSAADPVPMPRRRGRGEG